MPARRALDAVAGSFRDPRKAARINQTVGLALVLVLSLAFSYVFISRLGVQLFAMALVGIFFGTVYTIASFSNMLIPYFFWILSIGGFRFLFAIRAPGLPDLYLDRMAIVWLVTVFVVKFVAEGRRLAGPYLLDILLLLNCLYILVGIYVRDMTVFHDWTMSYLIPYLAYFFSKNLVRDLNQMRRLMWVLLALVTYYNITSIAEKFQLDALVWPKYILQSTMFKGRSGGPFEHAPLFGTVIGMLVPLHLYFIATVRNQFGRVLLYAGLAMGFAGVYFTYTRGSWLAGVVAVLTAVALGHRRYLKMVLPALVLVPVIAFSVLGVSQDRFARERFENQDTLGSRLGTFVTATKVWRQNPAFGVGFNQYRKIIDDYVEPLDLPVIGTITVRQFRDNPPHDIYVSFLAEAGFVGVALQGAIYLVILRTFLRHYRRRSGDEFSSLMLPVFGGLFAGYLAGGLAIDYKFFSIVGTLFYSCAGIMYGYRVAPETERAAASASPVLGAARMNGQVV